MPARSHRGHRPGWPAHWRGGARRLTVENLTAGPSHHGSRAAPVVTARTRRTLDGPTIECDRGRPGRAGMAAARPRMAFTAGASPPAPLPGQPVRLLVRCEHL